MGFGPVGTTAVQTNNSVGHILLSHHYKSEVTVLILLQVDTDVTDMSSAQYFPAYLQTLLARNTLHINIKIATWIRPGFHLLQYPISNTGQHHMLQKKAQETEAGSYRAICPQGIPLPSPPLVMVSYVLEPRGLKFLPNSYFVLLNPYFCNLLNHISAPFLFESC